MPDAVRLSAVLGRPDRWVVAGVVLILAYLVLPPLFYLLWQAFFQDTGHFTLSAFARAFGTGDTPELVANSLIFAFGATVLTVVIGTTLAFFTERTNVPGRAFIYLVALIPVVIPGLLYTISWVFLASPGSGFLNAVFEASFGVRPFSVFTMTGMIVVQGFDQVPLMFLLMVASFRSMDPSLEESAYVCGASRSQLAWRVTIPLARPAIFGGALIMAVRNLESFETPRILGVPSNVWVMTTRIYNVMHDKFPPDYGQSAAFSVLLLVAVTLGIYLHSRWTGQKGAFTTVTGKGFRPGKLDLGGWRWVIVAAIGIYVFIAIVLPLFILLYASFQPFYSAPTWATLFKGSLAPYQAIFKVPEAGRAMRNSLVLATGSATLAMMIAAVASWVVIRSRVRGAWMVDNLAFLPVVFPGIVLGVGLLFFYLRNPVPIYGTLWLLLIAYVTRFIPYAIRYSSASLYQIGGELEEAAEISGASWGQRFRRIMLPLMAPGLIAGWVYIFVIALRELSVSILVYPANGEVLSVVIWLWWYRGAFGQLSALGVLMILAMSALVLVARLVGGRFAAAQ